MPFKRPTEAAPEILDGRARVVERGDARGFPTENCCLSSLPPELSTDEPAKDLPAIRQVYSRALLGLTIRPRCRPGWVRTK